MWPWLSFTPHAGHELHPTPVALVQQHLQRLNAGVQQRQEPPVLLPCVVLEAVATPVGGPALGVGLLDERVRPGVGQLVHPPAQVIFGYGVEQVAACDAGRVANVDDAPLTPRRECAKPVGVSHHKRLSLSRESFALPGSASGCRDSRYPRAKEPSTDGGGGDGAGARRAPLRSPYSAVSASSAVLGPPAAGVDPRRLAGHALGLALKLPLCACFASALQKRLRHLGRCRHHLWVSLFYGFDGARPTRR